MRGSRQVAFIVALVAGSGVVGVAAVDRSFTGPKPHVTNMVTKTPRGPNASPRLPVPPRADGRNRDESTHGLYADFDVEQPTTGTEDWSFPAGTFDSSCGQLEWTISGLPANTSGTFNPADTALDGSTSPSIATTSTSPFGVSTLSITANCTQTPTTGPSAGGASQTLGIFQYPPDPTVSGAIALTLTPGGSGYYQLDDAGSSEFAPLYYQAWGAPGTSTFAHASTSGSPNADRLTLVVGPTTSPGAYAFSADVYSNTTYGESSPVTLYVSVVTPSPGATGVQPTPSPSPNVTVSPGNTPSPKPTRTPVPAATPSGAPASSPQAVYSSILPTLHANTTIPIMLPSNLSMALPNLFASIGSQTQNSYLVFIDALPNCHSANACRQLDVSAGPVSSPAPSPSGTPVALANGATGYFVGATCGSSCGDSSITWISGGTQYVIGVKAGLESDVLTAANSMQAF